MGFLDSLMKSLEDGSLEKSVSGAIDTAEAKLDKLVNSTENLVQKSEKLVNSGEIAPDKSNSVASDADS
jgi:hypothetical protein